MLHASCWRRSLRRRRQWNASMRHSMRRPLLAGGSAATSSRNPLVPMIRADLENPPRIRKHANACGRRPQPSLWTAAAAGEPAWRNSKMFTSEAEERKPQPTEVLTADQQTAAAAAVPTSRPEGQQQLLRCTFLLFQRFSTVAFVPPPARHRVHDLYGLALPSGLHLGVGSPERSFVLLQLHLVEGGTLYGVNQPHQRGPLPRPRLRSAENGLREVLVEEGGGHLGGQFSFILPGSLHHLLQRQKQKGRPMGGHAPRPAPPGRTRRFVPLPSAASSGLWWPRCRRCGRSRSGRGCWSRGG